MDHDGGLYAWFLVDSEDCSQPAQRMTRDGEAGQVQLAGEGAVGPGVLTFQLIHDEFQVFQPHRNGKAQRLFIASQRSYEMAAKNGLDEPSIGKLDGSCLVSVSHRGHHVSPAGEILKDKSVIGKRTRVTMCENDYGMKAICDRGIQAAVCLDFRQRDFHELRKIAPNLWRGVFSRLARLTERRRIPEPHQQLSFRAVSEEGIVAREVNHVHHPRPDTTGSCWTWRRCCLVHGQSRPQRSRRWLLPLTRQWHRLRTVGTVVADGDSSVSWPS